jgi:hypothetical protein
MFQGVKDQVIASKGAIDLEIYWGRAMEGLPPEANWQSVQWPAFDNLPEPVRRLSKWHMPEWASYADFFKCVREGKKPFCDAEMARVFGLSTMMIRKAMYEQRPVTWDEMA